MSKNEEKLLNLIKSGKNYNKQEFAIILGKSMVTVQRYLKHLTALKLIRREGSKKTGRWITEK